MIDLGNDWNEVLCDEFSKEYYTTLRNFLKEEFITANSAIMMYAPFLAAAESDHSGYDK